MEEFWTTDLEATLEDPEEPGVDDEPQPVPLEFEGGKEYQSVFAPLVKLEADYNKRFRSNYNIIGQWYIDMKLVAYFVFPKDNELQLVPGDELILKYPGDTTQCPWQSVGHVIQVTAQEGVTLELRASPGAPIDVNHNFSVEFVWRSTIFDRMQTAIEKFADEERRVSWYIFDCLLGRDVEKKTVRNTLPRRFGVPGLPKLDDSQRSAVETVLQNPVSLIQGPAGTGKTVTSAAIVYHLAKQNKGAVNKLYRHLDGNMRQVLVCAPSNAAVDQLAEKISATGLKVVRLCAKSKEAVTSLVEHLTLQYQVRHSDTFDNIELHKLQLQKDENIELSSADEKKYNVLKQATEGKIVRNADVICCTCFGAGDPRLSTKRFRQVLIVDSTHATEPECIIPLVLGCKQVVLVGDRCQLGSIIKCKKAAGLSQSLFDRLVLLGLFG